MNNLLNETDLNQSQTPPIIIGVTGGSGSGKSSVSHKLLEQFRDHSVMLIEQDAYYKDQAHLSFEERLLTNYDHPDAFDMELMSQQLAQLIAGQTVECPTYDYTNHTRSQTTVTLKPHDVIIVEGILILADPKLRDLMDIKLYVETEDDVRLSRRILRDIHERGRTVDSVIKQYLEVVKPMHHQYVEPTKRYADLIIPEGGFNLVAIDIIATKIAAILANC